MNTEEKQLTQPEETKQETTPTPTPTPVQVDITGMQEQLRILSETNSKLSQQIEEYNKKLVIKETPKPELTDVDLVTLFKNR